MDNLFCLFHFLFFKFPIVCTQLDYGFIVTCISLTAVRANGVIDFYIWSVCFYKFLS